MERSFRTLVVGFARRCVLNALRRSENQHLSLDRNYQIRRPGAQRLAAV